VNRECGHEPGEPHDARDVEDVRADDVADREVRLPAGGGEQADRELRHRCAHGDDRQPDHRRRDARHPRLHPSVALRERRPERAASVLDAILHTRPVGASIQQVPHASQLHTKGATGRPMPPLVPLIDVTSALPHREQLVGASWLAGRISCWCMLPPLVPVEESGRWSP
jgi:hypothetical protein